MSKAYTSNLTRDQFELIEPLLPRQSQGASPHSLPLGRAQRHFLPGEPGL
jgi:hypothetical protein